MSDAPRKYWRSLRELDGDARPSEQGQQEFMAGVTTEEFDPSRLSAMSRKQFLGLLAASAAFAAAGCTGYRDKGEIVPYTRTPEGITPGVPNSYASTCTGCRQACGILVKTREGRPIKIDGNSDHPVNQGKICASGQAAILGLYDPSRLQRPTYGPRSGRLGELPWSEVDDIVTRHLEECVRASREIAVLTRPVTSPTSARVFDDFAGRFPTARMYAYEVAGDENRRRSWRRCYGESSVPPIRWEEARVVVALESDLLGTEGDTLEQMRAFAAGRDIMRSADFNRLYAVEANLSLTGAHADYRLPLRPDAQLEFVLALLGELMDRHGVRGAGGAAIRRVSMEEVVKRYALSQAVVRHLVGDLAAHRGRAIVHAGAGLPEEVHVVVHYLNDVLGNGALYDWRHLRSMPLEVSPAEDVRALIGRMKAGAVGAVIHFDANPVYDLPPSLDYAQALKTVPLAVSMVEAEDETSAQCTYVLPVNNALESWGDHSVRAGIISLSQPVIAPLYDTRQREAVLLRWTDTKTEYAESLYLSYLKKRWEKEVAALAGARVDFAAFWHGALHDGVVSIEGRAQALRFRLEALRTVPAATEPTGGFVVVLAPSHYLKDGRFAANGWLQELPHPVSKVVWDNYAAISAASARSLGVATGDVVEISLGHGNLRAPVFVQPGVADNCVVLELGYGRWSAGPVGSGVGVNASALVDERALSGSRIYAGASLRPAGQTQEIVSTQEHHALDDEFLRDLHLKRHIVREGTLHEYRANPEFLHAERIELPSISTEVEYHGLKWAMAIDLNKCVGCNACVAGCNVENNIPVVGKEQVGKGREMQWIRIDRYYSGSPESPSLSHQPMLCQHCDNAPCENVCPVVATTHSPDGLNQMAYNRCVGTKYCSNNCPYKVRRFNFFNFRDHFADGYYGQEPVGLAHNPEVTVRSRGVMEKCTFCIQRIMEARQHAIAQGRELAGGDVKTACQEACPAQAIVFGDMSDPRSEVSACRAHHLGYHVLEETNARPNVTYVARLRNTHPENLT